MFTKSYLEFEKTASANFTLYEKTYISYIAEASRMINRALKTNLNAFATKAEHDAAITNADAFTQIKQYLVTTGSTKTSDSWRKSRRALAYYFRSAGFRTLSNEINEVENVFPAKLRSKKPQKKRRMLTVSQDIFDAIYNNRKEAGDTISLSMLSLCKELGMRPCEAPGLEIIHCDVEAMTMQIYIVGAKKTKRGEKDKSNQRGLDRVLTVPVTRELFDAVHAVESLTMSDITACQERIRKAVKKLWPNRTRRFCLYSLRYTMGSNLKAKYQKRRDGSKIIAAVMGHKCTSSMSVYGCVQSGSVKTGTPVPDPNTVKNVLDDRAKKHGVKGKFEVRKILSQSAVEKRDAQRQPSRRDIITRKTSIYGITEARDISKKQTSDKQNNTQKKD